MLKLKKTLNDTQLKELHDDIFGCLMNMKLNFFLASLLHQLVLRQSKDGANDEFTFNICGKQKLLGPRILTGLGCGKVPMVSKSTNERGVLKQKKFPQSRKIT